MNYYAGYLAADKYVEVEIRQITAMHVGHTVTNLPKDPENMLAGTKKGRHKIIYLGFRS